MESSEPILGHFKCARQISGFGLTERPNNPNGYFRFGPDICYGKTAAHTSSAPNGDLFDAPRSSRRSGSRMLLPVDPGQVLDNLRYERYLSVPGSQAWTQASWIKRFYYGVRPMLPVSIRSHLQRAYLLYRRGNPNFPSWPVDRTADILLEKLLAAAMQSSRVDRIPFIWFWPDGYKGAAIMTHDVETTAGRNFCDKLMDADDAFGIKSSFQIVPEKRYNISPPYLDSIRSRDFEVNVHGLDHEGDLFENRERFLECARKINNYAVQFGSRGFRSPCLYRKADWFQELNFSYDMSVPNVARLKPQPGGCCTVLPYVLPGRMLEIPLTTTQDYTLFHILRDYSITLWKQQMGLILKGHGLMHFLVHPDYVIADKAFGTYKKLLGEICRVKDAVWITLPREVDRWWRERDQMTLVPDAHHWRIEGAGRERARIAYACLEGDQLVYEVEAGPDSGTVLSTWAVD